ncbi:MlaD family protein [[Mycobacterium] nativiensis]|uniref:MlaD family protein n=1 Tax=[Mycobacterium] nativiensis TaxID=2855503 RepID=A0ABU5XXU2_9MYCO|nr:MlaD family protein [Mycolicibacter sp. MYC340]MEB3031826.1 MlaD family protein [Mycolicibacter sp. MYC340]
MTTRRHRLNTAARFVVNVSRTLARHRVVVALAGLALTMAVAAAYILIGGLRVNPIRSQFSVRVMLPESGGLLANQDVTLRGVPIGRVQSIDLTGNAVTAIATIDGGIRIPRDTAVRVSALSTAGEQYLDFRPASSGGPYLTDGSVVGEDHTSVPVPFHQVLAHMEGVLNQIDPATVDAILTEMRVGPKGPAKLSAIVNGGTFFISTLDSVLPETISTFRNSRTVLTTMVETQPGLRQTTRNMREVLGAANRMDGGFRRLVDTGSAPLQQLEALVADNSETMVQLLGNLTTIAQLSYVRVPALKALFPTERGSVLEGLADMVHDNALWLIGDVYPRYICDYKLPRLPASQPDFPEPYRYTYCDNPDPSVLIRGARNAPRPPGDDTAGPPPDYEPHATTDPTPGSASTIPATFGGPPMPSEPPS